MKKIPVFTGVKTALASALLVAISGNAMALDPSEVHYELKLLGKYVFFDGISKTRDDNKSVQGRMGCVTCHDPATGGTGTVSGVNLHQVAITGANPHTSGNLKPPTNAYASAIRFDQSTTPATAIQHGIAEFHECAFGIPLLCGGNFWNGRAEGLAVADQLFPDGATAHIGNEIFKGNGTLQAAYSVYFGPTPDQALNPMPNPVEQNIQRQAVCQHVASQKYAALYALVWGEPINCSTDPVGTETQFDISFKRLALAMGAWQSSADVSSFSSKRDIALANETDGQFPLAGLTDQENRGHDLFYGVTSDLNPDGKWARCSVCHNDNPPEPGNIPGDDGSEPFQLYADDAYHNIGTPKNPEIPDPDTADVGLAGHTGSQPIQGIFPIVPVGFFKTPTLRNVDKRKDPDFIKAYTHNGWFKSLESIVHFYNTAFIPPAPTCDTSDANYPENCTTAERFGITRCDPNRDWSEREALALNCWPEPAVAIGAPIGAFNPFLPPFVPAIGDLRLTADEEAAIVAYMKTLTDTHTATPPPPYKPTKVN